MKEQNPCRKVTLYQPEGTQKVDQPSIGWLDSTADVKTINIRN